LLLQLSSLYGSVIFSTLPAPVNLGALLPITTPYEQMLVPIFGIPSAYK